MPYPSLVSSEINGQPSLGYTRLGLVHYFGLCSTTVDMAVAPIQGAYLGGNSVTRGYAFRAHPGLYSVALPGRSICNKIAFDTSLHIHAGRTEPSQNGVTYALRAPLDGTLSPFHAIRSLVEQSLVFSAELTGACTVYVRA